MGRTEVADEVLLARVVRKAADEYLARRVLLAWRRRPRGRRGGLDRRRGGLRWRRAAGSALQRRGDAAAPRQRVRVARHRGLRLDLLAVDDVPVQHHP
eukprot:1752419-Prymnesium_polylepis.1